MSFCRLRDPIHFLERCYGARRVPRLTFTRGMPCIELKLWKRANREISCYVLPTLLLLLCHMAPVEATFMHDSKVTFTQGSGDHWTLLDRDQVPELQQLTVCVHLRVLAPGEWTAYTYGRPGTQEYELGLQGDRKSLYVWLLGKKHRFPVRLVPWRWYHVCLKRNTSRSSISLDVDGSPSMRTVVAEPVPSVGELVLGCRDRGEPPSGAGEVELYLFRVWDDVGHHGICEDGGVVAWRSEQWAMGNLHPLRDERLLCGHRRVKREAVPMSTTDDPSTATIPPLRPTTQDPPQPTSQVLPPSPPTTKAPPPPQPTTQDPPPPTSQAPPPFPPSMQGSPKPISQAPPPSPPTTQAPPPPQPTTQDPPPPTSQAPLPSSPTTQGPPSPTAQAPPPSPPTTQDPPLSTTGVPLPPSTQDPPQQTTQAPTPYTADPSLLLIKTEPTHPLLTTIHSASTTEHLSSQHPTTTPSPLSPMSNSPLTVFLPVLSTTSSPTTATNTASPTILAPVTPNTLTAVPQSTSSTFSPNTFTSFVLPTSLAFSSTTLSTSPPPTFSTKSASSSPSLTTPSMSLSTITMENFENASSTSNFTLTTAVSPNPVTGSLASLCSFSVYCTSNSSFYWMVLDVESTHGVKNESEVSTWLSNVFNIHICEQSEQSPETSTAANTTSTPMSSTVSPLDSAILKMAPSHSSTSFGKKEKKCQNGNETPVSLFQGIEVSCDDKEKIRQTNCTVLLNLTSATNPCVLHRALQVKVEGFTMQAQILGKVENVGIGLCHSGDVPPGGFYEKCSSPYPLSDDCNSEGGIMVSCNRSSNTVVIPVDPRSPVEQNCTEVIQPDPEHHCNCSTVCKDQAAYYMLTIGVTGPQITFTDIRSLIDKLGSDPPSCNSSFSNTHDLCTKIPKISKLYQEAHLECLGMGSQLNSCTVVLKMSGAVSICALRATLVSLFQTSEGIYYTNPLTRLVICDWPSGSRVNMSQVNLTWISTSLQYSEICANQSSINLTCKAGETLGVLLDDMCLPWPIPPVFGTASSAHYTLNATTTVDTSTMPPTSTAQHNTTFISSSPTLPRQPNTPPLNMTRAPLYTTGSLQNVTTPPPNTVNATKGDRPTKATVSSPNTTTSNKTVTAAGNSTNPVIPIKPTITATVSTTSPTTVPTTTVDAEGQAEQLLNLTRDVSSLNSSQVAQLVNQLAALLSGPNVSLDLGRTTVTIVSNLLNASVDALAPSSNKIIGLVDTVGLKLVVKDETETILSDSVALAVKKVDGANFEETSFSITNPSSVQINNVLRAQTSSAPQGSITLPASLTNGLTPEQQLLASRVQFNFYQKGTVFQDRDLRGRRLHSGILGTTVANLSISDLTDNVVITLRNNEPVPANFVASCVFWDFSKNNGLGGWNQHGCSVQNSTDEETVCSCNHLTSFAVLLDISREGIKNRLQSIILTYITYIGCGISAIFLSITLLTYLAFGKLRKDIPSKILIQLCTALLLLNLTFLLDSWLALYPDAVGLCISTAFFLHYFLLVSFTWMGLEALHMYLAIVKVFNTYVSRYMLKFSLVGWGIPLIVVIIVIAIDKNNYGLISYGKFEDGSTDEFCWLKNNVAFYVAVVAYFCVIFLVNLIMFVVVLVQLCRIKRQNPQNAQQRNGVHELRSVAGLTVLLGLTWGFAFFAWGPVNLAFMYLFSIFNSLQGLFIFIFHCALKENVRKQWRTYLCCGKLRLPENTEWSRTATRKTVNLRRANRGTSYGSSNSLHSSNTSSSSFLASDSTERQNGVGSMYDDRQITSLEEPNGDVVLNEIHSRHRTPRGQ